MEVETVVTAMTAEIQTLVTCGVAVAAAAPTTAGLVEMEAGLGTIEHHTY